MTGLVDQDGVAQFSELSGSAPCVISSACPAGWGIGSTGSGSWNTLWKQQYVPCPALALDSTRTGSSSRTDHHLDD